MSLTLFKQRIIDFLTDLYPKYNNADVIDNILKFMERIYFIIPLTKKESRSYYQSSAVIIPFLSYEGHFKWRCLEEKELEICKTLGRRISFKKEKNIRPFLFYHFQAVIFNYFRTKLSHFSGFYSNGIQFNLDSHTEATFLLSSPNRKHIDIIIRGPSPLELWNELEPVFHFTFQLEVHILRPDDIFSNTLLSPLTLNELNAIDTKLLVNPETANHDTLIMGKLGDINNQHYDSSPWAPLHVINPKF